MAFKVKLDDSGKNPANNTGNWLETQSKSLQTDPDFQIYLLRTSHTFAQQVQHELDEGTSVLFAQNPDWDFLSREQRHWPRVKSQIVRENPQGTQPPHMDNTEPDDPRRWNFFANSAPREAQTFVMDRELFWEYETEFRAISQAIRTKMSRIITDIETKTPLDPAWYKRFMDDQLETPVGEILPLYWLLEIMTKGYRKQNYLKAELDNLIAKIIQENPDRTHLQAWDQPGVLILDNTTTLHGRYCPNTSEVPSSERANVRRLWIAGTEPNVISKAMTG